MSRDGSASRVSRGAPAPSATDSTAIETRPRWSFGVGDWITTAAAGAIALSFAIAGPPSRRSARLGIDEDTRDALRFGTRQQRLFAADASDVLLAFLESYNFLVDAVIVTAWYRRSPSFGMRMALIDLQALLITAAIQGITTFAIGRERPYVRECLPGDQSRDCTVPDRFRSFFSGHTSQAFTSAALLCSHHARLPLYGGGAADWAPCLGGLAVASSIGVLRIMADKHYLTDVIAGTVLGSAVGFAVPWLLHYIHDSPRRVGRRTRPGSRAGVPIMIVPMGQGVAAVGQID